MNRRFPPIAWALVLFCFGLTGCGGCNGEEENVDTFAPTWPAGSELTASDVGITGVVLNWTAAEDDTAVTAYRLFQDEVQIQELGSVTTASVTGLSAETGYGFQVQAGDAAGNWSTGGPVATVTTTKDLPPDPTDIAPPLNTTVATSLGSSVAFLYTGDDPIQKGVDPEDIEAQRVAVLRGEVLDEDGLALSGATVKIVGRPEFGWTVSRADGRYDLVVNGGEHLVVRAEREDFLPSQRKMQVPWRDYVAVPPMRLVPPDNQVTTIDLSGGTQVARASSNTDEDGTRQATLVVPSGVQAQLKMPDGSTQALTSMNVRATEYTVGEAGPDRMPARLPANSGYTYAVNLGVDEAEAAGAADVEFDQPVYFYLENFLEFPAGTSVPMGYYDEDRGVWVPADSGKVIDIVAVNAGAATVDVDGDGQADTGQALDDLGITADELTRLGETYAAGDSLWRVGVTHFSAWDCNWGANPPSDAEAPDAAPQEPGDEGGCEQDGSVIDCTSQVLGEDLDLAGLPFGLHYRSNRVRGFLADYALDIPLRGPEVPASLKRIDLTIDVAGQHEEYEYDTDPDPGSPWDLHRFTWDGLDAYDRPMQGQAPISVGIGWVYDGVYQETDRFGYDGNGEEITGDRSRGELILWTRWSGSIGALDARALGFGSWTLGIHHFYDPNGRVLYRGDGAKHSAASYTRIIDTFAGGGWSWSDDMDGGPALGAGVGYPGQMEVGPRGELYLLNWSHLFRIERGRIYRMAGGFGSYEDDIPARDAQLDRGVGLATDGKRFYIAEDVNCRVRMIDEDGIIRTIAGTEDDCGFSGDGGPASEAKLDYPKGLALSPDGNLFIADYGNNRIRKIDPAGMISTVIGNGNCDSPTDGALAVETTVCDPDDLEVGPEGTLYFIENGNQVWAIAPDGIVRAVAGNGNLGNKGDGGPATEAEIAWPVCIEVDKEGKLYIFQSGEKTVRLVDHDGIIQKYAGNGSEFIEKGPALGAGFSDPNDIEIGQDGELYMSCSNDSAIRRVTTPFQGYAGQDDFVVPSRDGTEVYVFNPEGRHKQTLHAMTGAPLWTFAYNNDGLLMNITDADDNVVLIQRDGQGKPTAIVSPWGVTTALVVNDQGYLDSLTDPAGNAHGFTYGPGGLLGSMTDPNTNQYTFEYDGMGRITKDTDPATGFKELTRTEEEGEPNVFIQVTTAEGRVTGYRNHLMTNGEIERATVFPTGQTTHATLGQDASVHVTYPDWTEIHAQSAPDTRFGMHAPFISQYSITTPGGLVYDLEASRETTLTDEDPFKPTVTDTVTINGKDYVRTYDHPTRTWSFTTPEGRMLSIQLDEKGKIISSAMENSTLEPISYFYDDQGRIQSASQGTGADERIYSVSYDADGFIQILTDPESRVISFTRDPAGRVLSQVLPDLREIGFGYDANSNVTAVTPPGKPAHGMGYNAVNKLDAYDPPALQTGPTPTVYGYNLDRQMTLIDRPDGEDVTFHYNTTGRMTNYVHSHTTTVMEYGHDRGQLQSISNATGETLTYVWDGHLLTSERCETPEFTQTVGFGYNDDLQVNQISAAGAIIDYLHDDDGLITQAGDMAIARDPATGLVTGTTLNDVTTSITYNAFGEMDSYTASFQGSPIYEVTYVRDKLGRITEKDEIIEADSSHTEYVYDDAGRLIEVWVDDVKTAEYGYDSNSNRISYDDGNGPILATYDDQDRLLSYGDATFTYTDNGELASKTEGGVITYYQYDTVGNLRIVGDTDGLDIRYGIDGRNRRVAMKDSDVLVRGLLYKDQLSPVAELDAAGQRRSTFVYGTRRNVPDYMVESGVFRIIPDHLGSPRLVISSTTGAVVQRMDYDAFGVVLQDTNPGFQPFGFAGGIYEPDTGLVRFGVRDYSTLQGRWLSKDPILFMGNSTNLYRYAVQDPINWVDPDGMAPTLVRRFLGMFCVDSVYIPGELYEMCTNKGMLYPPEDVCADAPTAEDEEEDGSGSPGKVPDWVFKFLDNAPRTFMPIDSGEMVDNVKNSTQQRHDRANPHHNPHHR